MRKRAPFSLTEQLFFLVKGHVSAWPNEVADNAVAIGLRTADLFHGRFSRIKRQSISRLLINEVFGNYEGIVHKPRSSASCSVSDKSTNALIQWRSSESPTAITVPAPENATGYSAVPV
jgi:hypothetical protein